MPERKRGAKPRPPRDGPCDGPAGAPETRNLSDGAAGNGAPGPGKAPGAGAAPAVPTGRRKHAEKRGLRLTVEVIAGDITTVKAPVAVAGRYLGLPARGAALTFDRKLAAEKDKGGWLSQAIRAGMVGSDLGQLFLLPLDAWKKPGPIGPDLLVVAGLGEPGCLTRESLQFLMGNVAALVRSLGHDVFCAPPVAFSRNELPLEAVVRAMVMGIIEGLGRVTGVERHWAMRLKLVHAEHDVARRILEAARCAALEPAVSQGLEERLEVLPESARDLGRGTRPSSRPNPADEPCQDRTTRITVTCGPTDWTPGTGPEPDRLTFQYSALADKAVIALREQDVQSYFVSRLSARLSQATVDRLIEGALTQDQQRYGRLLRNYLIPDDFDTLIRAGDTLSLVLDATTACYPWEMAAYRCHLGTCFFGTQLKVSRQFRTLQTAVPGLAPPVNEELRVLVIADPAPGDRGLPGARREGLAVIEVLADAQERWGGRLKIDVTARIGAHADRGQDDLVRLLDQVRRKGPAVTSAEACDPLELLALLVNEEYDVVHYAGHGVFDPPAGRMGWVFEDGCVLSAAEVFRVRQVPRLVFANACLSGLVSGDGPEAVGNLGQRRRQVGLAQAFFARGIENYLGTGWAVDDEQAVTFAGEFYRHALGLGPGDAGSRPARPAAGTLGDAIALARQAILHKGSTWGAYHHYGQSGSRLAAPPEE